MSSVGESVGSVDLSVPVEVRVMGSEPVAVETVEALRCALDVVGVWGPYVNRSDSDVRFFVSVRLPGEPGSSEDVAAFLSTEAFLAHLDSLDNASADEVAAGGQDG